MSAFRDGVDVGSLTIRKLVLVVLAAGSVLVVPSSPASAADGTITGSVTYGTGAPVAQPRVYVTTFDGMTNFQFTGLANGTYTATVPPGTYCVSFGTSPWAGTTVSYPDKRHCRDDATPVVVTSAGANPGIDAVLHLGGIAGTVAAGGVPLPSVYVYGNIVGGTASSYAHTDLAGAFEIRDLPAGQYCVSAAGKSTGTPAVGPCRSGQQLVDVVANVITVGVTLEIPPAQANTGSISGTIRNSANTPLAGRSIEASGQDLYNYGYGSDTSDAGGVYLIDRLAPGDYCLTVVSEGDLVEAGEVYDNATSCDDATLVTVGSGPVVGVDIVLEEGGVITGAITDPLGAAAFGSVRAAGVDTNGDVSVYTGVGGVYTITGLESGQYCVQVSDNFGDRPSRVYGGGPSCERGAQLVSVTAGVTTSGIDIQFLQGGSIKGHITFPPGTDGTNVQLFTQDEDFDQSGYLTADASGNYEIPGLSPGRYCFHALSRNPSPLVRQVFGSSSPETCRQPFSITVVDGAATTLDFTMELGGSISGWVVTPNGLPDEDPGPSVSTSQGENDRTRPDGSYWVTGLPAGNYCLNMRGAGVLVLPQTYNGVRNCDDGATLVPVTAGVNTPNINFQMQPAASISGKLTGVGEGFDSYVELHRLDAPQAVIEVLAYHDGPGSARFGQNVPPGTYCVLARPLADSEFANRAFGGTASCSGATPVVLAPLTVRENVDIQLTRQIYVGLPTPARVLDSRAGELTVDGVGAGEGAVSGGSVREVQVGGRAGVPANAASVALNVTATNTTGPGFFTVFPCGVAVPTASNVNFTGPGLTTPNAVISKLGTGGKVCVYALTTADLIIDVAGYFPAADGFVPLAAPARLIDTRPGELTVDGVAAGSGAVSGGTVREVPVGGRAGVPDGAASVALNVTATNTTGPGFFTVFPCGVAVPTASNVNFTGAGLTTPNAVISKLGTGGKVCVYALTTADLIIDVAGYLPTADEFVPLVAPARLTDTRPGQLTVDGVAAGTGAVLGGSVREVQVGGRAALPDGAASVALNVTATNTTGPGFFTVFPCGVAVPTASNVNFTGAGLTTPNAVIAKLGTGGKVCVYALTTADLIIDVAGYFPAGDGKPVEDQHSD